MGNIRLGVNIDHVATVRNARGENYPSPLRAALLAQKNVLSEDEYKNKLSQLENNLKKYNEIISKKNKDLINFKKKSKKEFAKTLKTTLENYSKNNSISMILRKENLLIGKNSLDITKEILDLFNKS